MPKGEFESKCESNYGYKVNSQCSKFQKVTFLDLKKQSNFVVKEVNQLYHRLILATVILLNKS